MKLSFEDAVRRWVGEFNAIPQSLIEKAYGHEVFELEITPVPKKYECDTCSEEFDREEYDRAEENEYGDKHCPTCLENDEYSVAYIEEEDDHDSMDYGLPMWGTMWSFGTGLDDDWARNNLEVMSELGFKIYESDELGVFFGIDGAGYDFYEAHWNKLYLARGLRWHYIDSERTA